MNFFGWASDWREIQGMAYLGYPGALNVIEVRWTVFDLMVDWRDAG